MLLVRIIPLFEANRYCSLILKWSLNEGMSSFMVYKQANVSRHLGCLFQICMTKYSHLVLILCNSCQICSSHFTSKASPSHLHLGLLSQHPWLLTVGDPLECWSEPDRNRCPSWPSLFTVLDLRQATKFLSASVSSLIKSVKLSISQIYCHCCEYSYPHYHHIIIGHW